MLKFLSMDNEHVIASAILTYKTKATVRLFEIVPRAIFHNISSTYVDVYGLSFVPGCQCMFGNVSSPHVIVVSNN